ncbi:uncharacterized protein WCC33_014271 [Rhinophrynus dorsalis]
MNSVTIICGIIRWILCYVLQLWITQRISTRFPSKVQFLERNIVKRIGIFSREEETQYRWLWSRLKSKTQYVKEVKPFLITNSNGQAFRREVSCCDFAILYHSRTRGRLNITDVTDALYNDELDHLSSKLGKENVIVVVDHLDRCDVEVKRRILQKQPSIQSLAIDLILFSNADSGGIEQASGPAEEKVQQILSRVQSLNSAVHNHHYQFHGSSLRACNGSQNIHVITTNLAAHLSLKRINSSLEQGEYLNSPTQSLGRHMLFLLKVQPLLESAMRPDDVSQCEKVKSALCALLSVMLFPCSVLGFLVLCSVHKICCITGQIPHLVIGIFSRSSEDNYEWLRDEMASQAFNDLVKETRSVYISNNGGWRFRQEVDECNFAFLYHTKNQGRINITNVTDSLYDEELQYLSDALGKRNVIMVVDDLEDTTLEEKFRILKNQPDIGRLAEDMFLFGKKEKEHIHLMSPKLQQMRHIMISGTLQNPGLAEERAIPAIDGLNLIWTLYGINLEGESSLKSVCKLLIDLLNLGFGRVIIQL